MPKWKRFEAYCRRNSRNHLFSGINVPFVRFFSFCCSLFVCMRTGVKTSEHILPARFSTSKWCARFAATKKVVWTQPNWNQFSFLYVERLTRAPSTLFVRKNIHDYPIFILSNAGGMCSKCRFSDRVRNIWIVFFVVVWTKGRTFIIRKFQSKIN